MKQSLAQVIVAVNHQDVDRAFSYRIPENMTVLPGMRVRVPFGRQGTVEGIVQSLSDFSERENLKSISSCIDDRPLISPEQFELALWIKKRYHATMAQALHLFLPVRSGRAKTVTVVRLADEDRAEELLAGLRPGSKAYRIVSLLAENGDMEKAQLNHAVGSCYEALARLAEQGYVLQETRQAQRSPYLDISPEHTPFLTLNERQSAVLNEILASKDRFTPFLLHGVTGSGKTEVYMQAIRAVVDQGKSAIVLVPEISLTPQMVLNFRKKLGDGVAILHSALGAGERFDEWQRIASGEARIVIGARSAVFAPARNVGIIIVDEEHETSYLSETHPRYDAVSVAIKRAQLNKCPIVLGSATPSVVRYYQATKGKFRLLDMPERANGKPLPPVEIVDMTKEFARGNRTVFSESLFEKMRQTLSRGEQLMLFLNRRGYASFVMCRACGETISCEKCDVSLTYHSTVNKLRCHYCGYEIPMPAVCPSCGSKFIKQFGAGTQKVEEEFHRLFPGNRAVRMDVDTTRGKDAHYKLLKQLSDGSAQALIGTQMIAKGHDFPKVSLVGVVAADAMLRLPDYRSRERTFSLLTQVSGRAGRAQTPGRVVIQTYAPQHFVMEYAARHDYKAFFDAEIKERRAMWYPPFARIIRVLYTCEDAQKAFGASLAAHDAIKPIVEETGDSLLYLQRSAAPIGRLQDQYRHQVLIKIKEFKGLDDVVDRVFEAIAPLAGGSLYCDVQINPVSLF